MACLNFLCSCHFYVKFLLLSSLSPSLWQLTISLSFEIETFKPFFFLFFRGWEWAVRMASSFHLMSYQFFFFCFCMCVGTTYSRRSQTRQDTPTRKGRSIHPWEERGKGRTARGGDPLMWLKSFAPLLIAKCKYMVFSYHSQHTHAHTYNSIRPLSLSCLWESLLPFGATTRSFSCERKCIESLSGRRTNNNVYLFKSQ